MLMCGRLAHFSSVQKFADLFGAGAGFSLKPRYNIAPTQALLLARNAAWGNRQLGVPSLGLDPALVQGAEDRLAVHVPHTCRHVTSSN
jgi:putative SOS response-associated peptidase YedK